MLNQVYAHIDAHIGEYVELLKELCRQPSVSAEDEGLPEMAALLADVMQRLGIESQIMPSAGAPVVYGIAPGRQPRQVLLYNHYDVQPVDPLELWVSPPFEPTERDGRLYARGVADDKGDALARLAAAAALQDVLGELPLTVKFLIEGQEEIDGSAIYTFIREHADLLACDVCFLEGMGLAPDGRPQMTLGVKGMLFVELEARGPTVDAHSGTAPVVPNPAWDLIWLLSLMKKRDGHIEIPGFYDEIVPWSDVDRAALASLTDEQETNLRERLGLEDFLNGVSGLDFKEQLYGAPTCTVCGFQSGYGGPGVKTVLPATARVKLDFRLVPDQQPADILAKLRKFLDGHGFGHVTMRVLADAGLPARTPVDHPMVSHVASITRDYYGAEPITAPMSSGGCVMEPFIHALGAPTMFAGGCPQGGNGHAPNEYIELDSLAAAIKFNAYLLTRLAE